MAEETLVIKRDDLAWSREVIFLIAGFVVIGWLLLEFGFRKAIGGWAESLQYSLDQDKLSVSSCFTLWGLVIYRQEKRIPLAKITDVKLAQGPIFSKMNLWALHVQTAGTGYNRSEAVLYALAKPHEARDQILDAITTIQTSSR